MRRSWMFAVPLAMWLFVLVESAGAHGASQRQAPGLAPGQGVRQGGTSGWRIPPTAAEEKSPLTVNEAVVAAGKKLFASKCQRCHGPEGKGDGPDGDPANQPDMDLTVAAHAARNPDGVIFYKVWNGRASPKMPVFSEELSKEQVWALVAYVQTLRAK